MFRRRLSHTTVVAYLALFIALGGVSYAKFVLPNNSVGTKKLKNGAVTLPKIAVSTRAALHGARGLQGLRGLQGPAGPGALSLFFDTHQPFPVPRKLATVGPWTIDGACQNTGTGTILRVFAAGPSDSLVDGQELNAGGIDVPYSQFGTSNPNMADQLTPSAGANVSVSNVDLYSASARASAHVSLFEYAQAPSAGFRCKVSGTTFSATTAPAG